jgi:predicted GNAT family N-acyltransferase
MSETPRFKVRRADWGADEAAIAHVRQKIFIEEQGVPVALEWEALDAQCLWYVAVSQAGEVIGIVRLTPDARIGRMAVLAMWRRMGVGAALLAAALAEAHRQGPREVRLSAQTHAISFYARFGFKPEGDIFLDAGIPHRAMTFIFEDRK